MNLLMVIMVELSFIANSSSTPQVRLSLLRKVRLSHLQQCQHIHVFFAFVFFWIYKYWHTEREEKKIIFHFVGVIGGIWVLYCVYHSLKILCISREEDKGKIWTPKTGILDSCAFLQPTTYYLTPSQTLCSVTPAAWSMISAFRVFKSF